MTFIHPKPFAWRGRAVRGIIFDMDGTMCETKEAHGAAWDAWIGRHGITITREEYLARWFGKSNNEMIPELFPDLKDQAAIRERAMERENLFLDQVRAGKVEPIAGLHAFIDRAISRGLKLSIASSAPRDNVELITETFGLAEKIPVRLSMDNVRRAKPAPDLFLMAADHMGLDPDECVVLEDSRYGLEAARSAGSRAIALTTLHTASELGDLAALCVANFEELLRMEDWTEL